MTSTSDSSRLLSASFPTGLGPKTKKTYRFFQPIRIFHFDSFGSRGPGTLSSPPPSTVVLPAYSEIVDNGCCELQYLALSVFKIQTQSELFLVNVQFDKTAHKMLC